jgi:hypothetical protein
LCLRSDPRARPSGATAAPRPGPDALYGEHPVPPQLENGDGWEADPLLVSGAEAYAEREGELPVVLLCHSLGCSYNQYGIYR